MFGLFTKKQPPEPPKSFPPVPSWKPEIRQSNELITERVKYYTNQARDFAVFQFGTIAILPNGLDNQAAEDYAKQALQKVFHAHPDMHPLNMDDGNVLVRYNHDVASVVLTSVVEANLDEIDRRHQDALAAHEVLITPLGQNKFDAFGKSALFGRCYMFMDAQAPMVVTIVRCATKD
ncbi:hypothetical protein ABT364_07430 [Massilia sp. SR12]